MDTKKKAIIIIIFIVTAIIIFRVFTTKKTGKQHIFFTSKIISKNNKNKTDDPVLAKRTFLKNIQEYERKTEEERTKRKQNNLDRYQKKKQIKIKESNHIKKKFLKEVYLEGKLPKGLLYSEVDIDIDEPIKLIRGDTPYQEGRLLIGATTIVPEQPEEILAFVKENTNLFPDMNKGLVSKMMLTVQVKNPQPGFKQINVWEAHSRNKSEVLVYLPRSDNRGSYVFSYSGESSLIKDNDDYFEELLQSLKPRSAPKNIYKHVQ